MLTVVAIVLAAALVWLAVAVAFICLCIGAARADRAATRRTVTSRRPAAARRFAAVR